MKEDHHGIAALDHSALVEPYSLKATLDATGVGLFYSDFEPIADVA